MDQIDLRLRSLLLDVSNRLSDDDRVKFCFLLADDVPRRILDIVTRDNRASMSEIWDTLINRQKIGPGNVEYLIVRFERIRRLDIVRILRQYLTTANPDNQAQQASNSSDLFNRIDPQQQ